MSLTLPPVPTAARSWSKPPEPVFLKLHRAHGVLGIGYHKGRYMSRAAHEFIRIAKERLDYAPKK